MAGLENKGGGAVGTGGIIIAPFSTAFPSLLISTAQISFSNIPNLPISTTIPSPLVNPASSMVCCAVLRVSEILTPARLGKRVCDMMNESRAGKVDASSGGFRRSNCQYRMIGVSYVDPIWLLTSRRASVRKVASGVLDGQVTLRGLVEEIASVDVCSLWTGSTT
jgi:hypothetical protein